MRTALKQTTSNNIMRNQRNSISAQSGVGLIEVLIALVVLAIGALAVGNLQTASNVAMRNSADYFKLNELSYSIIEQLKSDSVNANAGQYNTSYTDVISDVSTANDASKRLIAWKSTVAYILPLGEMQINCASSECLVSLRWYESSRTGSNREVYNVRSPI